MYKVVYNACFGGFSLSLAAMKWLYDNGREEIKAIVKRKIQQSPLLTSGYHLDNILRHDPDLVRCVETIGFKASGNCACLEVHELKGNRYRIDVYDGFEGVIEPEDEEYITIK